MRVLVCRGALQFLGSLAVWRSMLGFGSWGLLLSMSAYRICTRFCRECCRVQTSVKLKALVVPCGLGYRHTKIRRVHLFFSALKPNFNLAQRKIQESVGAGSLKQADGLQWLECKCQWFCGQSWNQYVSCIPPLKLCLNACLVL